MKRFRWWMTLPFVTLVLGNPTNPGATEYFDDRRGEIQARLAVQNSFQHDGARTIDWVQERNEFRFDLKYELLRPSQPGWPLFRSARFNLLYRARYDAVFDIRDSYGDRGYDRDDFRFPEGKIPRELFLDLDLGGPLKSLSARIGRQQVVWGEADLFRSIDVVNPLRIDQNGIVGEDFSDYREPLWIAKFLWDVGQLGSLSEVGFEFFYSPNGQPQGDRPVIYGETWRIHSDENNLLDGFRRHTMLPFQQVRHPWEFGRVGNRFGDSPATVTNADGTRSDFFYQIRTDTPSTTFDLDRSMVGARLLGKTYGSVDFTLNYLFKHSDTPGSAVVYEDIFDPSLPGTGAIRPEILGEAVAAAGTPDLDGNGIPDGMDRQIRDCIDAVSPELILLSARSDPTNPALDTGATSTACLTIPVYHPWTHIIGATLTYNDYNYTGLVYRMEQSYSTKEARNDVYSTNPARGDVPQDFDFATHSIKVTPVWRSMIGFDYLRTIAPGYGRTLPDPFRSLLSDQWFLTFQFLNEYYAHADNQIGPITSETNRNHHWNPLFTLAATGFFLQNRMRPFLAFSYDVNEEHPLVLLQADYHLTQRLSLRLGEILYLGSTRAEDFIGLFRYADRDTLYARVTYYLM